jgi:hypothetical protein
MTSPSTAIPAIHIGRATPLGPVTYFPLWTDAPDTNGLVTGATALIDVAELPGQPEVSHLAVTNPSGAPALLIEGELLEGGWQHRVLQHDVIVGSGQSLVVDVACVEAGRWQEKGGHRRQSRRASPRIRAALHASPAPARQHEVWERVAGYETAFGASATSSYLDHVDHLTSQAPDVSDALESARASRAPGRAARHRLWCRRLPGRHRDIRVDRRPWQAHLGPDTRLAPPRRHRAGIWDRAGPRTQSTTPRRPPRRAHP